MAVTGKDVSFLLAARNLGASYERTLTIGRQFLFATAAELVEAHREVGQTLTADRAEALVREGKGFVEPVFRDLGAVTVDSLDASSYEGSTFVQDLNQPLADELRGRYTAVFDGGTLEHVFNLPEALRSCMRAVAPGGHLVAITPADSQIGHGFYQFSPELFYRALSPGNGFEMRTLLIRASARGASWRAVADPAQVGARVTGSSPWPTFMFVLARKISDAEPFEAWPQQSDYQTVWEGGALRPAQRVRSRVLARLPRGLRQAVDRARGDTAVLGRWSGPGHFRRVQLADLRLEAGAPSNPTGPAGEPGA